MAYRTSQYHPFTESCTLEDRDDVFRSIREVTEAKTGCRHQINDAWFEHLDEQDLIAIRRAAIADREWTCSQCGHGVYPTRHGITGTWFFRHLKGTPSDCPYYTGDTFDLADLDRLRYGGLNRVQFERHSFRWSYFLSTE